MPRRAGGPWYRAGRGWYATMDGKKVPLGVPDPEDRAAAEAAHRKLIEDVAREVSRQLATPGVASATRNVAAVVADYLSDCDRRVQAGRIDPRSVRNYRIALTQLATAFGPRPLASLTADEIERWADRPEWSASYQNTTLGTVQQLLRFAGCPLRVRRPPKESRGADACLSDEQFAAVLAAVERPVRGGNGDLGPLLRVLRETGARPAEVAFLTAEQVDWENCCARLRKHKTRAKTGRDRMLVFNSTAMGVLRDQFDRHRSGHLFRTKRGQPYQPNVIVKRLLDVSDDLGFRCIAYGLRHSFATRALTAGVPEAVVAALLGHTGTAMVARNYGHVGAQSRVLREAAERVSKAG